MSERDMIESEASQRHAHDGAAPRAEALEPLLYDRLGDFGLTKEERIKFELYLLAVQFAVEQGKELHPDDEAQIRGALGVGIGDSNA